MYVVFLLKTKPDSLTNQRLSGTNNVKIVQTSEIAKTCFGISKRVQPVLFKHKEIEVL